MLRRAGLVGITLALAAPVRAEEPATPDPPEAAADEQRSPLPGETIEYDYDGKDVRRPKLAWSARAYVLPEAAAAGKAVPLIVFLHGTNKRLVKYRWMGGGTDPDLRAVVGDMVRHGDIEPVVVAAPSSVVKSEVLHASWDYFDLDKFVARTQKALAGKVSIDPARVVVAGHSGAGCSTEGGLATLPAAKRRPLAVLSIDTCMRTWLAHRLSHVDKRTHVVVSYQTFSWTDRPFDDFRDNFARDLIKRPADEGVMRVVEELHPERPAHQGTVALTFARWLPKVLTPKAAPTATSGAAAGNADAR